MSENQPLYRSVFISDFHLGANRFDAGAVCNFLKSIRCHKLYLVGDIIDGWKLNKRWHWTPEYTHLFEILTALADQGTQIIYLTGNHDDDVRRIPPLISHSFVRIFGFHLKTKALHHTADNRRFLVIHGDQFDSLFVRGKISRASDRLWDWTMEVFDLYERPTIMVKGQRRRYSLAKALKSSGQWAYNRIINNFEGAVRRRAKRHNLDGMICGHTHVPTLKTLGRRVVYGNCGSWLEGSPHTALVENQNGRFEILTWPDDFSEGDRQEPEILDKHRIRAEQLRKAIQTIFPVKKRRGRRQPLDEEGDETEGDKSEFTHLQRYFELTMRNRARS